MEKIDRRKRKTQTAIKEAFIKLAAEKEIDKITIKELAEKADISRKTFYLNYIDINDLIESLENEIITNLLEEVKQYHFLNLSTDAYPFLLNICTELDKNPNFVKYLLANSSNLVQKLKDEIINEMKGRTLTDLVHIPEGFEYVLTFIISGLIDTFRQWYEDSSSNKMSLASLCMICSNLIDKGVHPLKANLK